MKKILLLTFILISLAACRKNVDRLRYKLSGLWEIEYFKKEYYSPQGNVDSLKEGKNLGVIVLQDGGDGFSKFHSYIDNTTLPDDAPVIAKYEWNNWNIESAPARRLTIWWEDKFIVYTRRAFYTIVNYTKNKMIIELISFQQPNSIYPFWKEYVELKRVKN